MPFLTNTQNSKVKLELLLSCNRERKQLKFVQPFFDRMNLQPFLLIEMMIIIRKEKDSIEKYFRIFL